MRFATLFPIGQGGMGSIEVAVDREQSPPKIVALKRLLADIAKDKRHVEAFLREARVALLLTHPNIVRAHWVGEQDGQVMLAMDYIEGETLREVLAEGKLSPELAAYVMAEVCAGLHAAHELSDVGGNALNLVHRDVSPHNVMIAYDGRVLVLDFGVAKIDSKQGLTKTGEVKGKTAYMSPEQALGDPLDRRSDLYAVGAVLYECVAGRKMWLGDTDMAVLKQLALSDPPKLDDPSLADLAYQLVSRDRDARPKTAAEVEAALRPLAGTKDALAALMRERFSTRIEEKKRDLDAALEGRENAEELRASIVPASQTKPATPSAITKAPKRSRWPVALFAVGLVAIPGAFFLARRDPKPAETIAPSPSPPIASSAPVESAAPVPSTSVAPTTTRSAAVPMIRTTLRPSAVPSTSASHRPPDVDPHPF